MRVLHVCSSLAKDIGGPARSVQGLVASLNSAGCESWLLALKPLGDPWMDGIVHFECANCQSFKGVRKAVKLAIERCRPDVVHIHSIWMLNMHETAVACRQMHVPYVFSVRGALNPYAIHQHGWKKRLAIWLYQGRDFRLAAGFHATSQEECDAIRRIVPAAKIAIIPNGVNVPAELPVRQTSPNGKKRLLYLARIHPLKGLPELLQAWAKIDGSIRENWILQIVGNDDGGYWKELRSLPCWKLICDSVEAHGFVDDAAKWQVYRNADGFVLPSHSENFGIVVAEALYAGLPVITTTNTPWHDLISNRCGWHIDLSVGNLSHAIEEMIVLSDETRAEMGAKGHELIVGKYAWAAASKAIRDFYSELTN